jgi:hypothetical protein
LAYGRFGVKYQAKCKSFPNVRKVAQSGKSPRLQKQPYARFGDLKSETNREEQDDKQIEAVISCFQKGRAMALIADIVMRAEAIEVLRNQEMM